VWGFKEGHQRHPPQWNKWLVWNGRYWAPDDSEKVSRLAGATVRKMYKEASLLKDDDERKAMAKWAVKCEAILDRLFGEYGCSLPEGLLNARKFDQHQTELARLFGKRFVAGVETKDGQQLNEA
jgi:phage/plasmid-associated DNA primase